ncbi:DUF317 domain-containing protein [Streptomyces sp. RPT161]|uniref:DUF317 domain-containing protein n=1 Tax=Streptomyces sp. RPT161 TaxID=3015993 RepID=UPI0022B9350D|nr:DUF317 domain-containing protein [Streptomyces sp. RPT161]
MTKDLRGAAAVRHIDQAKELKVSPVYLAGEDRSGAARVLLPLRDDLGWSVGSTGIANVVLDSPCRRARIGYLPTHPLYSSLWVVRIAPGPLHPYQWSAVFSHGTPSEIVADFAEALAYDLVGGGRDALRPEREFDRVLSALIRAGWHKVQEVRGAEGAEGVRDGGKLTFNSPDSLARIRWIDGSEVDADTRELGPHTGWAFSAGLPGAGWSALFSPEVPDHLVAAASRRLAVVQPVFRDERELVPELRKHLTISLVSTDQRTATGRDWSRRRREPRHGS